jgi:hypothetical protein
MAWEQVGRRRYYYRSQWVKGRSVRLYIGTGPAAADDLRKLKRELAARERQAEQSRHHQAEAPLLALCRLTDLLTRATLITSGFHQHDRGTWRRCRDTQRTP